MYAVYLSGSSKPVWKYKTWRGLQNRLDWLAKQTSHVQVKVRVGIFATEYPVTLSRNYVGYGWDARPKGIPTPTGRGNFSWHAWRVDESWIEGKPNARPD